MENQIVDNGGPNLLVNGVLFLIALVLIFLVRYIVIKIKSGKRK